MSLLAYIILRVCGISGSIPPPPIMLGGSLDEIANLRDSTDYAIDMKVLI